MFRRTRRIVAVTVMTAAAAALPAASASADAGTMSDLLARGVTAAPTAPTTAIVVAAHDATAAAGKPPVKIKFTVRVRPTGG